MIKTRIKYYLISTFFAVAILLVSLTGITCHSPTAPKGNAPPDTTSSNFTWQVDTVGAEGSVLYDCTVINDSLAYLSGSIYFRDSTGRSDMSHPYNFIKWNGKNWKYYTLRYFPPGSAGDSAYGPGTAIYANNQSDIWVSAGVPFHFNGSRWAAYYNTGANEANKIWESADNKQLYFIGNNGMITYSSDQGSSWQKVETGTTLPFQDIWGDGGQVLAVASNKFTTGGKYIVELNSNKANEINDIIPTAVSLSGIWFIKNRKYFLVGDGIYKKNFLSDSVWVQDPFHIVFRYYPYAVRGNGINDVVIAGDKSSIAHFNGKNWTKYNLGQSSSDILYSVSIKNNLVIAVGYRYVSGGEYYGIIYLGRR